MRIFASIALCVSFALFAQKASYVPDTSTAYGRAISMARPYEVKAMPKPGWAEHEGEALFRMCWFSDLHIAPGAAMDIVTKACNVARDELKPDFVLITGDNSMYFANIPEKYAKRPIAFKRQVWLKAFLKRELALPYEILPGDNDAEWFDDVFGSFHRSFDYCGFHFLLAGTDVGGTLEGCSVFSDESFKWMKDNLSANSNKPTFFVMHETMWPPFFLDAGRTSAMLNNAPQVLAAFSGHVHLDLDFERGQWRQLTAPSLGRSHRPAFKYVRFYKDIVIFESYEWDGSDFKKASKWQKIDVPEKLQAAIRRGAGKENAEELPKSPKKLDKGLNARTNELSGALMGFIFSFGVNRILGN